jgi:adenylosuccinate synthase
MEKTEGLRTWDDLPSRARDYLAWLQDLIGCEVSLISTGPGRDETILVEGSRLRRWFPALRSAPP